MKNNQEKANDLKQEIFLYATNAKLEEALKLLLDLAIIANTGKLQSIQQMKFQYRKIIYENIEGVLSREQYNLEVNRIFKNLISFTNTLHEEIINIESVVVGTANNLDATQQPNNDREQVIFECTDLGKTYKKTKFSLSNINLTIKNAEITAVAGANAVGKTTLLRLIASDLLPDYGTFEYPMLLEQGKMNYTLLKQQIAYIPQELSKWHGTLKSSIHFEAAMHGIVGKANEQAVDYILARLGLEKYSANSWTELSSGYKFRFHLAKALVWQPKLLILDEPLANLDIKTQRIVLNDLRNLVKNGNFPLSVVMSSQHLREIEEIADYFIFLSEQRIVFQGSIHDLNLESQTKIYEIYTSAPIEALQKVMQDLAVKITPLHQNLFVLEVDETVSHQVVFGYLARLEQEVKHISNITHSLKRFFL